MVRGEKRVEKGADGEDARPTSSKKVRIEEVKEEALNQEDDDPRGASWGEYLDTRTGEELDPKDVAAARKDDIEYMRSIGLYEKAGVE